MHYQKFHCPLSKISLHYQTVIDQRIAAFEQLLCWTSFGPLKCLIDKVIDRFAVPSDSLSRKWSLSVSLAVHVLYLIFSLDLMARILLMTSYDKGI